MKARKAMDQLIYLHRIGYLRIAAVSKERRKMKKEKILEKILFYLNGAVLGLVLGLIFSTCQKEEWINAGSTSVSANSLKEEKKEEEKICYLTFDDGPSKNTIRILDTLKEFNAKATFFVIGNALTEENRPILERIIKEGHSIGLHANDHVYEKFYQNENSWEEDYHLLYERLKKEYGIETCYFRFPGGSACAYMKGDVKDHIKKMHEKGFLCYDWNVSGEDAVGNPTVKSIYDHVMKGALQYHTPIVLLHDSVVSEVTADALFEIMEGLSEQGYRFETLVSRKEYVFRNSRPEE